MLYAGVPAPSFLHVCSMDNVRDRAPYPSFLSLDAIAFIN
jgi:hypothetical protein